MEVASQVPEASTEGHGFVDKGWGVENPKNPKKITRANLRKKLNIRLRSEVLSPKPALGKKKPPCVLQRGPRIRAAEGAFFFFWGYKAWSSRRGFVLFRIDAAYLARNTLNKERRGYCLRSPYKPPERWTLESSV